MLQVSVVVPAEAAGEAVVVTVAAAVGAVVVMALGALLLHT